MGAKYAQYNVLQRLRTRDHDSVGRRHSSQRCRQPRRVLSYEARPFAPGADLGNEHLTAHQQQLGERLYPKVLMIE